MIYLNIFFLSIFLILVLLNYFSNNSFITDTPKNEIRKIHNKNVIIIGGITFVSLLLIYPNIEDKFLKNTLLMSYFFLIVGLLGDTKFLHSILPRFTILLLGIIFFVLNNDLIIQDFNHEILNLLLNNYYFISIIFSILGLMFLINGFNFVDGNNGLAIGLASIICVNFLFHLENQNDLILLLSSFLLVSVTLFLFNFFTGRILIGDGGSYFCGFFVGTMSIYLANENIIISTKIACIIFYPFMEIFLTFWRRVLINKVNPLKPDFLHLHSLLYTFILIKYEEKNKVFSFNKINSLTSFIILASLIILTLLSNLIMPHIGYLNTFFMLCFLYCIVYIVLIRLVKINK
tara:strand:+ start:1606 stop:2646 length:1041 start_codon:yes stop_codon:yes gene_type:complete